MPDFNQAEPPQRITDPNGKPKGFHEFPKQLHKFNGFDEDGHPNLNRYVVVHNAAEESVRLDEGWSREHQVAPAADEKKAAKSSK